MAPDFKKLTYTTVYQDVGPIAVTLTAGTAAAVIATFDVTPLSRLTISVAVTVAALTGFEVWARGDRNAKWIPLALSQVEAYGRDDAGTDVTTTPAGASGFVQLVALGWSEVQIRAKSAGAAALTITAGGK
ncbi:hypothetical protein ACEN9F_13430 [Duganella sp. CT11-25]|uniref:hypothetical protein n=1 Tax=unclassified Duganella TaxID=2636909 RepID=UPI0039AEF34E